MVVHKNGAVNRMALSPIPKTWILFLLVAVSVFFVTFAESRSSGIAYDDVKNGCICHSGSATSNVTISISDLPGKFEASEIYNLKITLTGGPEVTSDSQNHGGFSLTSSVGTLSSKDEYTQLMEDGSLTHTSAGNNQRIWEVQWTAPSDDSQSVEFKVGGNSVNGDDEPNEPDQWNILETTVEGVNYSEDNSFLSSVSLSLVICVLIIGAISRRHHV